MGNDLISRVALLEALPKDDTVFSLDVRKAVCDAPGVDADVVRHADFEPQPETVLYEAIATPMRCTGCDATFIVFFDSPIKTLFCPCCGAMRNVNAEVKA